MHEQCAALAHQLTVNESLKTENLWYAGEQRYVTNVNYYLDIFY